MPDSSEEQLPIGVIASVTGVNAVTLRAWERRYGLIKPLRTAKGHRLYTRRHIEQIRRALMLVERGVPISRVRKLLDAETVETPLTISGTGWSTYVDRMSAAIASFDELELDRIYEEALSIHSIDRVTRQLLLPLLANVGERWSRFPGGVAEEHFFATYLRSKLGARLMHRMRHAVGPTLLAACVPGEQHEIGLLLFAIEAHAADMKTILLGADTPVDEVLAARRRTSGNAVVISASTDAAAGFLKEALPKLVRESGVPVFVGGYIADRHRKVISGAGATALSGEIRDSIRLIRSALQKPAP